MALKVIKGSALVHSDFAAGRIVQKFISGYDVTIPVFIDAHNRKLMVGDATVYLPSETNAKSWVYDREAKEAYVGGMSVEVVSRLQIPLEKHLSNDICRFCSLIGIDCFARVDFRLEVDRIEDLENIYAEALAFIEINPMPTVCVGLAFVESIRSWVKRCNGENGSTLGGGLNLNDDYDIIAWVLGHALWSQLGPAKMNDRHQIGS